MIGATAGTPLRDVKRPRTQGGWAQVEASPVKTEALPEVKVEIKSEVDPAVKAEVKAEPVAGAAGETSPQLCLAMVSGAKFVPLAWRTHGSVLSGWSSVLFTAVT